MDRLQSGMATSASSVMDNNTQAMIYAIIHTYVEQAMHSALVYAAITDSDVTPNIIKQAMIYESVAKEGAGAPCERAMKRIMGTDEDGDDESTDSFIEQRLVVHVSHYADMLQNNPRVPRHSIIAEMIESSLGKLSTDSTDNIYDEMQEEDIKDEVQDATQAFLEEWTSIENNSLPPLTPVGKMVLAALQPKHK